jgi:thioredoxin reductase (NADPH)
VANPKIKILYSHVVEEVLGVAEDHVTGRRREEPQDGREDHVEARWPSALFVAIGHTPR